MSRLTTETTKSSPQERASTSSSPESSHTFRATPHQPSPQVASRGSSQSTHSRTETGSTYQDDETVEENSSASRRFKIASIILFACILSFVLQTELTKFVQDSMGYHKPYFILYIAHSFWAILLPLQFIFSSYISKDARQSLSTFRERAEYFADLVRQSTRELFNKKADYTLVCGTGQNHAIPANLSASTLANTTAASKYSSSFTSREKKVLARHLFWVTLTMTILFMVPSYLWYTGVALTSMANLTAIYNTACFFAYLFSVLLLREKIVLNKVIAVFLSLLGVGIIFLASRLHSNPPDDDNKAQVVGKSSIVGDTVALVCAALYGFEEVMYKKYASVKIHSVTFANTMTGLMGVLTLVFLWVPIPILHWAGYEIFELPKVNEFLSILMIAVLGLVYNGCFMIVVSMTNPVFAAVGVMATIPIVALTDWLLFKEPIGWGNIAGGLCILIGFAILTRENHKSLKNM